MKKITWIFSIIIIGFSLYLVGSSISNLQNIDAKYDYKTQALLTQWNEASNGMLELCTTTDNLVDLRGCKRESIPDIIESCNDSDFSSLPVCSDVRLKEFSNTVDDRIESARIHLDELLNNLDIAQSKVIELCSVEKYDLDSCKNSMLSIKNECIKQKQSSIPSCNDPRIEMILDKEPELNSSISEQIPLSNEQQAEYARIIRDCSRDNEIIAKEYLSKFANVDSLTDNQEESIQSNSERISICSADIREIESDYCDLFNPSCTETGRFEMYWGSVSKIQSAYEQICATTGKFCVYTFDGP